MAARHFITEVFSSYTDIVITRPTLSLSAEIFKQLSHNPKLKVRKAFDLNSPDLYTQPANILIHFAGFENDSLAETLYHTSALHRLMDLALRQKAKLILVLPEKNSSLKDTAISLVNQFGKNFRLDYKIISVPDEFDIETTCEEIIKTFHKHHTRPIVAPPQVADVVKKEAVIKKEKVTKEKRNFHWSKQIQLVLGLLLILFIIPWGLFVSQVIILAAALNCGYTNLPSGNWAMSRMCGQIVERLSPFLASQSQFVLGADYLSAKFGAPIYPTTQATKRIGEVIVGSSVWSEKVLALSGSITGGKNEPLTLPPSTLVDQMAYVQSDLKQITGRAATLLRVEDWGKRILLSKSLISKYQLLVPELNKILSLDSAKILILVQDNNELRPTGGFLSDIAIVSMGSGQITSITPHTSFEMDKLLRGQVTPPEEFSKATGEKSWYLRDSNWDPDFNNSADRAAWFVEKELGQPIDLVVGANWEFVKSLLAAIGPVDLDGQQVSSDNLNNIVLETAKSDGGNQELMEQLSSNFLSRWLLLPDKNKQKFMASLLSQLESRQLLISDLSQNEKWNAVGWSGSVGLADCTDQECVSDFWYVVDSNIGINKSNAFVTSSHDLQVKFANGKLQSTRKIVYVNTSRKSAWPAGDYKNYLRIYLPLNSKIERLVVEGKPVTEFDLSATDNLQVLGILLTVPAGGTSSVEVSTTQTAEIVDKTSYFLKILNQPGAKPIPLKIDINLPSGWKTSFLSSGLVASSSGLKYNTQLRTPLDIQTEITTNGK